MKKLLLLLFTLSSLIANAQKLSQINNKTTYNHWVGTWATAQQWPMKQFMPYNNDMTNRSVRQIVKVSVGGDIMRLKISNEESSEPLIIKSIYIATSKDSFAIEQKTARYVKFDGHKAVEILPGKAATSDALRFMLKPLQRLAITINYKKAPKTPTVHQGSRTTTYIMHGVTDEDTDFSTAFREDHWFNIAAIDVFNNAAKSIAIIGNSITDGKNTNTNAQNRWPDIMSEELNSAKNKMNIGVLNLGIGGNCVVGNGSIGPLAKDRFDRDILEQQGVKAVIVFEGINDLGHSRDGKTMARLIIEQYKVMIHKARLHHLIIYGATITPMKGAGYYNATHEEGRKMVNEWIRTSNEFDGVIDFDALMRNPAEPEAMRKEWQSDWLHPNVEGYKVMGLHAAEFIRKMKTFEN